MAESVKIGIVGCGAISGNYLRFAPNFPILDIVAVADLDRAKAEARAAEFGVPRVCGVDELLDDEAIEIVLNLTVPKAHVPVGLQAVERGKHHFCEKPLGVTREEGLRLVDAAEARGVRLGCAPDTFLGAGIQTAREALDSGIIGRPVAFTAYNMGRGHESWHPSPEFYYEVGGGPMFDMGPYYLTALLNLFGPVKRQMALTGIQIPERTITSEPKKGQRIRVETPDHYCGTLEFANGVIGTIITTFAVLHAEYNRQQPITVFGTEGTLRVPDPNGFDGVVHVRRIGEEEWTELPHTFIKGYGRAVGLADMATAIRSGRPHRCSSEQAFYVLDLMQGFLDSSATGQAVVPVRGYARPAPMVADMPFGQLDD